MSVAKPKIGVPEYKLDEQVGFMLRKASQRHLAIFAEHIADLTPTQFAALAKLYELGRVSQNQLGRNTAMDAATIKGVVDRLRKRGLVKTTSDLQDRRRLYVEPTGLGCETFENFVAPAHHITERTLETLSPKERQRFLELLEKLT